MHDTLHAPSRWITRFAESIPAGSRVLDLACGGGRHVRWLAARGLQVTGVDRDAAALEPLRACGEMIVADLEAAPWPLPGRSFDAVVVTNYLWRPLLRPIADVLAPGALLLYETFAVGHEAHGKPSNPHFLLQPRELLEAFADLRVMAFEDGFESPPPRCVQRLAARREGPLTVASQRHRLGGGDG